MTREMKDSGIEWIGEIPEEWEVVRNKNIFNRKKEIIENEWKNTQLLSLTTKGIIKKDISILEGKLPESFSTYQVVNKGDLVLCLFDLDMSAVFNGYCQYDGMISPAYKRYVLKTEGDLRYYNYLFDFIFDKRKYKIYSTTLRFTLDNQEFDRIPTIKPNLKQQIEIANFLDRKTKQIEDIKNKISKEIENLEDYKKSVITEAVTKGLYKNVEMKDSGIEWIGEIPKHWKVNRLKFLVIDRQAGIWGKEVESEGEDRNIICIRVADFDFPRMTIRKDRGFTVRNYSNIDIIKYYLDKGDILVEKSGGGEKSPVGRTIIWEENFVAVYANFIERIRMDQNKICPMYAQYVFYAFYNMGISNLFFNQTTGIQNLDLSKMIRTLRFPVPSLNDQLNIINYLNKVIKILDETIEAKQKQLEILEEYRKSLIYEYVTGKKEVEDGEET